jgi:hypothetical protein
MVFQDVNHTKWSYFISFSKDGACHFNYLELKLNGRWEVKAGAIHFKFSEKQIQGIMDIKRGQNIISFNNVSNTRKLKKQVTSQGTFVPVSELMGYAGKKQTTDALRLFQ